VIDGLSPTNHTEPQNYNPINKRQAIPKADPMMTEKTVLIRSNAIVATRMSFILIAVTFDWKICAKYVSHP